ncbi:AAA family ATPase [Dactylosporangium matsuzakiense]|uniref:Broad-specificity NMP kinase n=1 Tax=Dactylosporangium matsuzakiense TaxID=53360 RepID=A0A9W6NPD9_9ACTN|nr:AAA family ATPase [Dactylosporangium matsuzakiense]UWZ41938.1 hypothetical protein Dmats_30485 [Dactylosporangium matsuzakiense]GLL04394.1 hypothetical protein GCM10017581_061410 [Dactylosporangium matsuzakiense]
MHYCQRCDEPVAMAPRGDLAVCPDCGHTEPARRLPLFIVTGASGSGKTTVLPHLVRGLPECLVFDADWLIGPFERACEFGEVDWPALRDAWLSVAHGAAQSGRPTVLLAPFTREQLDVLAGRRWIRELYFAVLDCPDDVRTARLEARPRWRERAIDRHLAFAAHLRATVDPVVRTDDVSPEQSAAHIIAWVNRTLSP